MKKENNRSYYIGLAIIIVLFSAFAIHNVLDYIKKNKVITSNRSDDREPVADKFLKKFNEVPAFNFVNQAGDTITNESLKGSVYAVEFFFTTCPTICTPMNVNIQKIADRFKDNPEFKILSITIDPEHDTVAVLNEYAKRYDAKAGKWNFVTGDKDATYKLSREGFKSYVDVSTNKNIRFEHSGNIALVDRNGFIRSRKDKNGNFIYAYNAISENQMPDQINEFMEDAETLLNN